MAQINVNMNEKKNINNSVKKCLKTYKYILRNPRVDRSIALSSFFLNQIQTKHSVLSRKFTKNIYTQIGKEGKQA